jgi:uncharacterized protein (DUF849 family)
LRFNDDSLYPEKMAPLIITAAPYGPAWLPGDADVSVSWDEQIQAAGDCFDAGARVLHVHVRNPATGRLSAKIEHFNYFMERIKKAVPDMIVQVGGSIAFDHPKDDGQVNWLSYDTRHMLAEITPKPETVTIAIGTCMMDLTQMWTPDDIKGTHLEREPKAMAAWAGMFTDAGPAFYLEHLKRLRKNGIQPFFTLAHVHQLEIVERLIRHGAYMGPLNTNITTYGGGGCGHNPYDWMHWLQRQPQGAVVTFWAAMRVAAVAQPLALIMGQHCRVGNEDNLWNAKRERMTTVEQLKAITSLADRFGRKIATAKEAREIMKIGVWYNSVDETLKALGMPPNHGDDDRGFMVWETDGKKAVAHAMSDSHPMAYCMVPPDQTGAKK